MTQREKIEMLKSTIAHLYEKEGRSKSYISRLLEVDRKTLSETINKEWKLEQGNFSYLTPSNQKFLNRNRDFIKSRLDRNFYVSNIANELNVKAEYLTSTIIPKDKVLDKAMKDNLIRRERASKERVEKIKENSARNYGIIDIDGEEWKEILGHKGYYVSNKGRVKKYAKKYKDFYLIATLPNQRNGRIYVWMNNKGFQVSRLVAFAFVDGYSEENNTVNHKDGKVENNASENLEWVTQSYNNQHSYDELDRPVNVAHQKHGKFKKIVLNNKYEFKTIKALAKFIGKSETQVRRYIDKECKSDYVFEFIY